MVYSYLILVLVLILLIAAVAWHVFSSKHHEQIRKKKNRLNALNRILTNSEEMISDTGGIPMSQSLLVIIYRRIARILKEMYLIEATPQIQAQFESVQEQLKQTIETPPPKVKFVVPADDARCSHLIKASKQIMNLIRIEFSNSSISNHLYTAEMQRLRSLQLNIYGETALRKAQTEINGDRLENARTLLIRYSEGINNEIYKECPNLNHYIDHINSLIVDINERQQHVKAQKEHAEAQRAEEIDQLLGRSERKKWR